MDIEKHEISEPMTIALDSTKSSNTTPSTLPWVEKYRPSSLSELIAHEEIISICMSYFY